MSILDGRDMHDRRMIGWAALDGIEALDCRTVRGIGGQSVTLALTGTGVLSGATAQISDAAGIATFSALSIDLTGSKQLSATSGALPSATSTSFTVSGCRRRTKIIDSI